MNFALSSSAPLGASIMKHEVEKVEQDFDKKWIWIIACLVSILLLVLFFIICKLHQAKKREEDALRIAYSEVGRNNLLTASGDIKTVEEDKPVRTKKGKPKTQKDFDDF